MRTDRRAHALAAGLLLALLSAMPASAHPGPRVERYAWVSPPSGLEAPATARGRTVTLTDELLDQGRADVWTPDLQALATVAGEAPVEVSLLPHDPADWSAPSGLTVSGNAYEIRIDGEVTDAAALLLPPHPVTHVARWDGTSWDTQVVTPGPDGEVRVPWDGPGPYVAAAARLDGHTSWIGALVHDPGRVLLLIAGLAGLALGVRHRERRRVRR